MKVIMTCLPSGEESLEHHEMSLNPHFLRIYICFDGCKDSFFKCKHILGLNGCFIKEY